eukprot:19713-Rhodomonas_salina.1
MLAAKGRKLPQLALTKHHGPANPVVGNPWGKNQHERDAAADRDRQRQRQTETETDGVGDAERSGTLWGVVGAERCVLKRCCERPEAATDADGDGEREREEERKGEEGREC